MLLANLSGVDVEVTISGWPTATHVSIMDAYSWEQHLATRDRPWNVRLGSSPSGYRLSPYAIARLEAPE